MKIATEEAGVREVCNVLKLHMNSSEVAEAACAGLLALSLDGEWLQCLLVGSCTCRQKVCVEF